MGRGRKRTIAEKTTQAERYGIDCNLAKSLIKEGISLEDIRVLALQGVKAFESRPKPKEVLEERPELRFLIRGKYR